AATTTAHPYLSAQFDVVGAASVSGTFSWNEGRAFASGDVPDIREPLRRRAQRAGRQRGVARRQIGDMRFGVGTRARPVGAAIRVADVQRAEDLVVADDVGHVR